MNHWATAVFRVGIAFLLLCNLLTVSLIIVELRRTNQLLNVICQARVQTTIIANGVQITSLPVCP